MTLFGGPVFKSRNYLVVLYSKSLEIGQMPYLNFISEGESICVRFKQALIAQFNSFS